MSISEQQKYTTVLRNGRTVGYYFGVPPLEEEQDYMSVTVPAEDRSSREQLQGRHFQFADRSILLELPLRKFRPAVSAGEKYKISMERDWRIEDVYSVASESFDNDPRFAIDKEQKDVALKNELLHWYIGVRKECEDTATFLYRDNLLIGFNLWRVKGPDGRVMLGAMSKQYQGTGHALSLYSATLCAMRDAGTDVLREYIAGSNTSSLNIHAMLIRFADGAFRFGSCRDIYQKERSLPV